MEAIGLKNELNEASLRAGILGFNEKLDDWSMIFSHSTILKGIIIAKNRTMMKSQLSINYIKKWKFLYDQDKLNST